MSQQTITAPARGVTAPQLLALSMGHNCAGPDECHWCGAPCQRIFVHDGPPPLPFVKNDPTARYPAHHYVCTGCRLFRRARNTVQFLDGKSYKDGQSLTDYSLLLSDYGIRGIRKEDYPLLWENLLHPHPRFVLSLIDEGQKNHLQLALVNDFQQIRADTPLRFSYNNVPHSYTVYEIKEAIQSGGTEGKEPGVRVLAQSTRTRRAHVRRT